MADCVIENLHLGMNLRDLAQVIAPGETGLSLGCDFSVPGQVTPMQAGKATWTLPSTIIDAKIIYLGTTLYRLTTHSEGLRINGTLIDASFTGIFKALAINNEYIVLSNGVLNKKWKPGWTVTYPWGLNTPATPTIAAGTSLNKTVDDFEILTDWSDDGGGGVSGNLQADTTHNRGTGTQSMRLTLDALSTIVATKLTTLDLSKFVTAGDLGVIPYLQLSYYTDDLAAIQAITIKLSCAADGAFTKDYYKLVVTLGGYVYSTISPTGGDNSGTYDTTIADIDDPSSWGSSGQQAKYYMRKGDTPQYFELQPDGSIISVDESQIPLIVTTQTIKIQAKQRTVTSGSGSWTDFQAPLSKFARIGDTTGRDWATITAISIEVEAAAVDADISFDDFKMVGGGNLYGWYWAAVAFQNAQGNYGPYTPFVGPIELDTQGLVLSGLTPDTDAQTIKRRIMLIGGSITQPFVTYLEDNTSISTEINVVESELTTVESYFNNQPPPTGIKDMVEIGGRIFIVKGGNELIYSEPLMYESFPLKNYRTVVNGESLYQVSVYSDGYVAARGKGREYITQVTGATPTYWPSYQGATQGSVSSRLLLQDPAGPQVFMSENGFYASGPQVRGEYLEKINPVIANHSGVFGDMIPDRAYLCFEDTDGISRVMRIDYRLGHPVAHYVVNMTPASIFADNIANKVYYTYGAIIYEFDADDEYLPATLTIPGMLCGSSRLKSFESLIYELAGETLGMALVLDRIAQSGSYSLPSAVRQVTPLSLPPLVGQHLSLILTSQGEDFTIYLPWIIEQVPV